MRLAVLLPLLHPVLLSEVGDTVPNPMYSVGQRVLTALHLGLDLLAKRPTGGGHCTAAQGAQRDERRQDRHGCFAFGRGRQCGCVSGCHDLPRFFGDLAQT